MRGQEKLLEACQRAERFVSWFRNMVVEGQISVSYYAWQIEHPSDWDTIDRLREAIAYLKEGNGINLQWEERAKKEMKEKK